VRVLGIDPGSRATGYGVVERRAGGRLVPVSYGTIKASAASTLPERLLVVSDALDSLARDSRPDAVSIESVFYSKSVKSAVVLAHARGVALASAARHGIEVFEYPPRTIKQAVVGYGGASKEQVQKMVGALLATDEEPAPDAADALAVAICHINSSWAGLLRTPARDGRSAARSAAALKKA